MGKVGSLSGWLKLHRRVQSNSLWLSEPFSRGQAWVDMLMLANYREGFVRVRGRRIDVAVGSIARSQTTLAERWKWSRGKVIRFLKELESDGQITQSTSHDFNVINICNYKEYQEDDTRDGTRDESRDDTRDEPVTVHETVHIKELQESKEGKEGKKTEGRKRESVTLPTWMPEPLWKDYVASRRSMKKHPMSVSALNLTLSAIEATNAAGVPIGQIMDRMTANGWRSCKPAWFEDEPNRNESSEEKAKRFADEIRSEYQSNESEALSHAS